MTNFSRLAVMLICLSFVFPVSAANKRDPKKMAIKARQAEMHLRSFNAGPLFAMAKGKMPYDAKLAGKLAGNLELMLKLDNGRAWMQGTSNKEYPDNTTALPKIWETWPKIADYGKDYGKAVKELSAEAGNGKDALAKKVKALGKACKECHDEFREKDK
ncbi:MAG: cytochrome c [Gammaproteobacteria bacterium]|nr:cytochrome c [Gammaproteobacteria bacterium]